MVLGGTDVLSTTERIHALAVTLIATDVPRQAAWQLANARRNGAALAEVRAVRAAAMDVARRAGVVWRTGVPDVEE